MRQNGEPVEGNNQARWPKQNKRREEDCRLVGTGRPDASQDFAGGKTGAHFSPLDISRSTARRTQFALSKSARTIPETSRRRGAP